MRPIRSIAVAFAASVLAAGALPLIAETHATTAPATAPSGIIAEGRVTQISSTHGNVYTGIKPDQYEKLGLVAGKRIEVTLGEKTIPMKIGERYTDVAAGEPVAVLHREGLTFAIRDGNFSKTHAVQRGQSFKIAPAPSAE